MLMLLETGFDGAAKVRVDFCMATQNFIDRPIGLFMPHCSTHCFTAISVFSDKAVFRRDLTGSG